MQLDKKQIKSLMVFGIIFIVYNILTFALPWYKNSTFWVAYLFGVIALFAQTLFIQTALKNGKDAKSRFYGFPIAKLGITYTCVQLVLSFAVMMTSVWIPVVLAVIVFLLIFAAAAIGLIATDSIRDEIERQDFQLKKNVQTMRSLRSQITCIVNQCDDGEVLLKLKKLEDQFKYSDPVSSDALSDIEADLVAYVDELQSAVMDKDYPSAHTFCADVEATLEERNKICKLNK